MWGRRESRFAARTPAQSDEIGIRCRYAAVGPMVFLPHWPEITHSRLVGVGRNTHCRSGTLALVLLAPERPILFGPHGLPAAVVDDDPLFVKVKCCVS